MIAALALSVLPKVIAIEDESADIVTLQAVVRIPELTPRYRLGLRAVCDLLMAGTEEYSATTLRRYLNQTGSEPTIQFLPGCIRIGLTLPGDQFRTGVSMLDSLLRRASFEPAAVASWSPKTTIKDYWEATLLGSLPNVKDLRTGDIRDSYLRYFRPENTTIAVAGKLEPGAVERISERFSDWNPPRPRPPALDLNREQPLFATEFNVNTVELRSIELEPAAAGFPTDLLAAYALSVGKGSSFHRIARETLHWSYRQEGVLWPSPKGFRFRMILARQERDFDVSGATKLRELMVADIDRWADVDLQRAQSIAKLGMVHGIGPQPWRLSTSRPLDDSLQERAAMAAYWFALTGTNWNPAAVCDRMARVDLTSLKEAARKLLDQASVQVVLGRGSD